MREKTLAAVLRARADWLSLPINDPTPRPEISREQFNTAADKLDELADAKTRLEDLLFVMPGGDWSLAELLDYLSTMFPEDPAQ